MVILTGTGTLQKPPGSQTRRSGTDVERTILIRETVPGWEYSRFGGETLSDPSVSAV